MKIDWAFPKKVLIVLAVVGCLAWYPLAVYGTREILIAVAAGALLATVNVLLGFASIEYCQGKSTTVFFNVVLGGMGIRLLLMTLTIAFLLMVLHLHTVALVSSLGVLYSVFLALEVLFIHKTVSNKS